MNCQRCGKWAGAHATLPGQPKDHLCMCQVARTTDGLPIIPGRPEHPAGPADGAVAQCGVCGLRIMPVMGYVCSNPRCGVFPVVTCAA